MKRGALMHVIAPSGTQRVFGPQVNVDPTDTCSPPPANMCA